MNTSKRHFLPVIIVAMVASLSSCSSDTTPSKNIVSVSPAPTTSNNISSPSSNQNPSMAQLRAKSANNEPQESLSENTPTTSPKAITSKTINVTLYTSDTQCQELIPQKVTVGAKAPVTDAVGKILEQRDTADFSLSGYRVKVQNGLATVDLRVSPESKRQLASLSSCEQFALFGSLRKTLTSNAKWNIKEVRFTEKGENIEL